jgi:hypothetical protein
MPDKGIQVVVKFPAEVPTIAQGPALLHMEKELRALTKLDVRVVKELMGDDSKLRIRMTPQQREAL